MNKLCETEHKMIKIELYRSRIKQLRRYFNEFIFGQGKSSDLSKHEEGQWEVRVCQMNEKVERCELITTQVNDLYAIACESLQDVQACSVLWER